MSVVPIENIFEHDDDPTGFDIIFEASELGLPPGKPPDEITLELPNREVIKFDCCGRVVDQKRVGDQWVDNLLYWSYWNESGATQAINLKILND